jgi:N-ethylmaleimide reductase
MSLSDIAETLREFRQASAYAIDAGFDGVEIHSANGYLLEQFLHPHFNRRRDAYGGTVENRSRFVVEAARICADAVGAARLGIRFSPYGTFNEMPIYADTHELYSQLAKSLKGLLYVHLIDSEHQGYPHTLAAIRSGFAGPIIRNLGYDRARAQAALDAGEADLVSFGRPFVANPDLVARMQCGAALSAPNPDTFYTPGAQGYTDYPEQA